jgi:hypothetical protein
MAKLTQLPPQSIRLHKHYAHVRAQNENVDAPIRTRFAVIAWRYGSSSARSSTRSTISLSMATGVKSILEAGGHEFNGWYLFSSRDYPAGRDRL